MKKSQELAGKTADKIDKVMTNKKLKFILFNWRTIVMVVYTVSPIDIIPDVVPILGWADDVSIIIVLTRALLRQYSQTDFKNANSVKALTSSVISTVNTVNTMKTKQPIVTSNADQTLPVNSTTTKQTLSTTDKINTLTNANGISVQNTSANDLAKLNFGESFTKGEL